MINGMDDENSKQLDTIFGALSDPKRRAVLRQLAAGEASISELSAPFGEMSFEGVSKHLRVLESAGLVQRTVKGRTHIFRLQPETLSAVDEWLQFYQQFWTNQFDALEAVLKSENEKHSQDEQAAQQATDSQTDQPRKP
jgi:DNA-binding transcriptional ArsR family regulator